MFDWGKMAMIITLACVPSSKYKTVKEFLAGGPEGAKQYTIEVACKHYGYKQCEIRPNLNLCVNEGAEEACTCWELWGK